MFSKLRTGTVSSIFVKACTTSTRIIMTENPNRRTFVKGAAATGLAAAGLGAMSGGAAAQQNIRNLNLGDVAASDGLLSINLQNINVLRNVNVQDVVVTVIGGDLRILEGGIDISFEEEVINVENVDVDVLNNALNNNNVQVGVAVLGDADNVLAAGDTIA